jgi:hypothetical protein
VRAPRARDAVRVNKLDVCARGTETFGNARSLFAPTAPYSTNASASLQSSNTPISSLPPRQPSLTLTPRAAKKKLFACL